MIEIIMVPSYSHLTAPGVIAKLNRALGRVGGGDLERGKHTRQLFDGISFNSWTQSTLE